MLSDLLLLMLRLLDLDDEALRGAEGGGQRRAKMGWWGGGGAQPREREGREGREGTYAFSDEASASAARFLAACNQAINQCNHCQRTVAAPHTLHLRSPPEPHARRVARACEERSRQDFLGAGAYSQPPVAR